MERETYRAAWRLVQAAPDNYAAWDVCARIFSSWVRAYGEVRAAELARECEGEENVS